MKGFTQVGYKTFDLRLEVLLKRSLNVSREFLKVRYPDLFERYLEYDTQHTKIIRLGKSVNRVLVCIQYFFKSPQRQRNRGVRKFKCLAEALPINSQTLVFPYSFFDLSQIYVPGNIIKPVYENTSRDLEVSFFHKRLS